MTAGRFMCADPSCISPCCPETAGTGPLPCEGAYRRNVGAHVPAAPPPERCVGKAPAGVPEGHAMRPRPPSRRSQEQPGTSPRVPPAGTDAEKTPTVDKKGKPADRSPRCGCNKRYFPSIARCFSVRVRIPASPKASSASSSRREKERPSPVPWISINSPTSFITRFISTCARESS